MGLVKGMWSILGEQDRRRREAEKRQKQIQELRARANQRKKAEVLEFEDACIGTPPSGSGETAFQAELSE